MSAVRDRWQLGAHAADCLRGGRPSRWRIRYQAEVETGVLDVVNARPRLETGGLFFGAAGGRLLDILRFTGPGPRAVHRSEEYKPDASHDLAAAQEMREVHGLEAIGSFHSHVRHRDAEPSVDDLTAWRRWRAAFEVETFVGLIVVRDGAGWSFCAHVVRAGGAVDVCERAIWPAR